MTDQELDQAFARVRELAPSVFEIARREKCTPKPRAPRKPRKKPVRTGPLTQAERDAREAAAQAKRESKALVRQMFRQWEIARLSMARINDPKQYRKLTPAQHDKILFNLREARDTTNRLLALSRGEQPPAAPTP
ncbi:MAG: hypothetical protein WDO69_05595 [Pseudomonadota bacterium]